jgi:hypothetical protein
MSIKINKWNAEMGTWNIDQGRGDHSNIKSPASIILHPAT